MTIMTIETITNAVEKTVAICPKCGREYSAPPAISRTDNETEICPVCGMVEALEPLPISDEERERLIAEAEEAEIRHGRVKARPSKPQSAQSTQSGQSWQSGQSTQSDTNDVALSKNGDRT